MGKKALITGITGQDGAYLARLLLAKGYEVYGARRQTSLANTWRLQELGVADDVRLVSLDLLESANLSRIMDEIGPDEIYNLAAQSFVGLSFDQPVHTTNVDALGAVRMLEAMRTVRSGARFYQASSSEMFGRAVSTPQSETTPFSPRSPYAVAKLYAHWAAVNYREAYGLHVSTGILFNHESPLRGAEFVTRKITIGLARIRHGVQQDLALGNLEATRDWGFAGDYVEGMWSMTQQPAGDDFVLATGRAHTVEAFADAAAAALGMALEWEGSGAGRVGIERRTGAVRIKVDPAYYRPSDVQALRGCAEKAHSRLGWQPRMDFDSLVELMARTDYDRVAAGTLRA